MSSIQLTPVDKARRVEGPLLPPLLVGLGLLTAMILAPHAAAAGADAVAPSIIIRPIDPVEAKKVSYTLQIHGVLETKCGACHGGATPAAGFKVSPFPVLMKGGVHGPAILPGKPDESSIVQYIRGIKKPRMPMGADPLTVDELHLLRQWISAGARDDTEEQKAKAGANGGAPVPTATALPVEDESGLTLVQIREKHVARLPAPPAVPTVQAPVFNEIDHFIAEVWEANHFALPPVCDDTTFVRRVYLDLSGVIPTPAEAQAFTEDPAPDRRKRLIDRLLDRSEDYAVAWIPFWEDALASNGKHQGGTGSHPNLRGWLMENLKHNRPYDEMVAELIDPAFPSPTAGQTRGWIRNGDYVETTQTAANVAQVFLGTALKCASCHNHFLNAEWPQKKFVSFASYFSPKDLEIIRCEVHEGEFVNPKFIFDQPAARQAPPKELDSRLKQVARLVVDPENPRFSRSIVNRLWKRYFGLGLVEPADDFRVDRAASHPKLLDWLANDFMRHGYDLKHTIRLILNSRTYQLRYDPRLADVFNVSKPDLARYYRSPGLRRLTAEQFLDSVNVALEGVSPRLYADDNSTTLTRVLGKPASRNEVSTARSDDVAVVQALEILNGDEFSARIAAGKLPGVLSGEKDLARVVTRAYQGVYNRAPTPAELELGRRFLSSDPETNAPRQSADTVWVDDEVPAGAHLQGAWEWVENPVKIGKKAHTSPIVAGSSQHYFSDAATHLKIGAGDTLFCDVYLDPAAKPQELMLQWNDGGWDHRAYWGENLIAFGADGTPARMHLGPLPEAGRWVHLEVPAAQVGLAGREINGMSFDQFGGRVYFDRAGVVHGPTPGQAVTDMLWALVVNPEFQYIR